MTPDRHKAGTSAVGHPVRRLHLVVLAVGTFTLGVDGFVLAGLLPQVSSDLRVSVSTAGQLTTLFAGVYAVGSPVIATMTGRWDRRTLLITGMAVFTIGMVLQASGPVFVVVALGRVIAAIGAAAYQANAYSTAGLLSDDAHRSRSLAVVAGGSSLALVAGLPFGIFLGQAWGWRGAIWVIAALAVVSGLFAFMLPSVHAPKTSFRERVRVLADRRVLGILVGTVVALTPAFLVIAFLPVVLDRSGFIVVIATLGYGIGQLAGNTVVSRVIDRLGPRWTLVSAACLAAVAAAGLSVVRDETPAAVAALGVLGFGVGLAIVPQQSRLFLLTPRLAPVAVGLNGSAIYVGTALGSAAGGLIIAATGGGWLAPAAFVVAFTAVVVAITVRPEAQPT